MFANELTLRSYFFEDVEESRKRKEMDEDELDDWRRRESDGGERRRRMYTAAFTSLWFRQITPVL